MEAARAALGPAIAAKHASNGSLAVITLDPQLEHSLLEAVRPGENGTFLAIDGGTAEAIVGDVTRLATAAEERGASPVLACSPQLRPPLTRLLRAGARSEPVLSYPEIAGASSAIETMGVVNGAYAGAA